MSYIDDHDKRMKTLRLNSQQFAAALKARGFVYDPKRNRWNGPFGISTPGDSPHPVIRDDLDRAYARGAAVRYVDTEIAGKRRSLSK